jgi:Uma2 family endonuclease
MSTLKKEEKHYTFPEYLKMEEESHEKHDFFFGEVYNMAGGTIRHNLLTGSIYSALKSNFKGKKCMVLFNDVKLELKSNDFYVYPDVIVSCDKNDMLNTKDNIIRHPSIIIEVLSDSTELYDRNIKKHYYLQLPSLKYFLLVAQNETRIEMYEKIEDRIEYSFYEDATQPVHFRQFNFEMSVADIYNME